jgi:hypothetical protein
VLARSFPGARTEKNVEKTQYSKNHPTLVGDPPVIPHAEYVAKECAISPSKKRAIKRPKLPFFAPTGINIWCRQVSVLTVAKINISFFSYLGSATEIWRSEGRMLAKMLHEPTRKTGA